MYLSEPGKWECRQPPRPRSLGNCHVAPTNFLRRVSASSGSIANAPDKDNQEQLAVLGNVKPPLFRDGWWLRSVPVAKDTMIRRLERKLCYESRQEAQLPT